MVCERLVTCVFFNDRMERMASDSERLKSEYCRGAYADCARYLVASKLGGVAVPADLHPTDARRARNLLAAIC